MAELPRAQPRRRAARRRARWRLALIALAVALLASCAQEAATAPLDAPSPGRSFASATPAAPPHSPEASRSPNPSFAPPSADATPSARTSAVATRIRIPRLGIDLRVVEGDGIDAPLDKAAHYPGSAWPGGGSNIYIYAHAREGLFLDLWDVRRGDEVILDTKDGASWSYTVTEIRPRTPYDAVEILEPTPTEQLTLQTSTSYTATAPRFVVIALPAEP